VGIGSDIRHRQTVWSAGLSASHIPMLQAFRSCAPRRSLSNPRLSQNHLRKSGFR